MTTKPEAIALIEAALAAGPTDGPWIAAGPSFGMALPKYLNEVVVNREGDDDQIYLVCVCPLGLDGDQESSVTMDYISIVNPTAMREVLAHIAAQDAEIARLREALEDLFGADMEYLLMLDGKDDQIEAIAKARAALTTKGTT